jgi:hypothetical protein
MLSDIIHLGLGLMFLWSTLLKLYRFPLFHQAIGSYGIAPANMVTRIGLSIVSIECLLAVGFISRTAIQTVSFAAVTLLLLFTGAFMIVIVKRQRVHSCGCISLKPSGVNTFSIARNLSLIGVILLALYPNTATMVIVSCAICWICALVYEKREHLRRRLGKSRHFVNGNRPFAA